MPPHPGLQSRVLGGWWTSSAGQVSSWLARCRRSCRVWRSPSASEEPLLRSSPWPPTRREPTGTAAGTVLLADGEVMWGRGSTGHSEALWFLSWSLLLALLQCGSAPQRQTLRHRRQQGRLRPESAGGEAGRLQGLRPGWSHL